MPEHADLDAAGRVQAAGLPQPDGQRRIPGVQSDLCMGSFRAASISASSIGAGGHDMPRISIEKIPRSSMSAGSSPGSTAAPSPRRLSGSDQGTSVGPDLASGTKVCQAVPEVYDPATDRNIPPENARRLLTLYPRSFVVQRGSGKNDWKVCSIAK